MQIFRDRLTQATDKHKNMKTSAKQGNFHRSPD